MVRSAWRDEVNRPAKVRDGFITEIESLRGVAITLVFLLHADAWLTWSGPTGPSRSVSALWAFVAGGHTGVTLFFILSGFLLSRPFLEEGLGGRRVSRRGYYCRRALRILPLYCTVVVVASVLTARTPADVLRALPYLVFLNAAGLASPIFPYDSVWWTLATEVQFYLLLPLLPFLVGSPRKRRVGMAVLVLYATAYGAFVAGRLHMPSAAGQWYLGESVFGRGPLFAFGAAAAWFCHRYGERVRAWATGTAWVLRGGADVALLGVIVCLGLLLQRVALITYAGAELRWPVWHIFEGGLWTLVLLLLLLVPLRSKRLLSNRWWSAVGLLSYSIYLIHDPLIVFSLAGLRQLYPSKFNAWGLAAVTAIALVAVLCLAMSAVTYWMIERPFLQRKVRISWWSVAEAPAPIPVQAQGGT